MESNCQNCNTLIVNNFCDNCGQKRFKKIDKKYITDELQYTFLHANKGLLYSVKNIFLNPGKTAREFIDGNRVNHYKPLLLVFVLSGISAFISFQLIGYTEIMSAHYTAEHQNSEFMSDYLIFVSKYNSFIMLLLVPVFAISTKIAFYKWGHNFYEHVVINAYILSFYTLYTIVIVSPIFYYLKNDPASMATAAMCSMVVTPFILVWFFKEFYKDRSLKSIIGRSLIAMVLFGIIMLIILIIAMIVMGFVMYSIRGADAVNYFAPKNAIK